MNIERWIRTFVPRPIFNGFESSVRVGADRSQARRLSRAIAARSSDRVRGGPFEEPPLTLNQAVRPRAGRCERIAEAKVRIHLPPAESHVSGRNSRCRVEKPGFAAGVRATASGAVGRDAQ